MSQLNQTNTSQELSKLKSKPQSISNNITKLEDNGLYADAMYLLSLHKEITEQISHLENSNN